MSNQIKMVTLKNGIEESEICVKVHMLSLEILFKEKPITFYEFVMKCRNPKHEMFGDTANDLIDLNLMNKNNQIHDTTRNIVLSAVTGEGLEMKLESPVQPNEHGITITPFSLTNTK